MQLHSAEASVLQGINNFCFLFFTSAGIGILFALTSALLLKHIDLRKHPSLEFGMMLIFTYGPYTLAEGVHLSGSCEFAPLKGVLTNYYLNKAP